MIQNKNTLIEHYKNACEVELQAFKPGNVSIYSEGHDMTVADFRLSADVSALPLCEPNYSLGEKIFTRQKRLMMPSVVIRIWGLFCCVRL